MPPEKQFARRSEPSKAGFKSGQIDVRESVPAGGRARGGSCAGRGSAGPREVRGRGVWLGAAVGARPTTLTSVLDRLERRGHIPRGVRPGDRRSVLIEPTESGRAAAAAITRTLTAVERRAPDGLPRDAVAGCYAVLDALTKAEA